MPSAVLRVGRKPYSLLLAAGLVSSASLLTGCGGGSGPGDVTGRYILSISDADMTATAIFDQQLTPQVDAAGNPARDSLTIIGLPLENKSDREYVTPYAQLFDVSNSVVGPPNAVAVSLDGRRAYVIESRGRAPAGATTTADLPTGRLVTAIDLNDPFKPAVIGSVDVGDAPLGVDVHPSGELIAVVTSQARKQLVLVTVSSGGLGEAIAYPLMGLDTDEDVYASSIQWHPSGEFLGVTLPSRNQVVFYRVTHDTDGSLGVSAWGSPVTVGKFPYSGKFSPDGKYFITTDMEWDMNVAGSFVQSPEGHLSVIRFDAGPPGIVPPHNEVVSSAVVGVNPEGLAISPDGSLVVTSNFQRTFLPTDDSRLTREGSLSLLRLDKSSGQLTPVSEYPISGMPAGLSFDARGRFVVVTQFRSFDPAAVDGMLVFFKVRGGGSPSLERADFTVGVGKGPHGVLIIR